MDISLTPELEQLVVDKVEAGLYPTASDVISDGLESAERGEFTEYDKSTIEELSDRIKKRGRERLADVRFQNNIR